MITSYLDPLLGCLCLEFSEFASGNNGLQLLET